MTKTTANWTLVVEGGGLRGAFAAGVLLEIGRSALPPPERIFATSAGAPSAAYLATDQIDRAVELWRNNTHGRHLIATRHLLARKPLMDITRLVDCFVGERPLEVDRFESCPEVYLAMTSCRTGLAHQHRVTPTTAVDALHATMALPLAYGRTVKLGGEEYIDGGLTGAIGIAPALQLNPRRILVVLSRPPGYRKRPVPGWSKAIVALQYRRHPAISRAYALWHESYNRSLAHVERLEQQGRIQVIRPSAPLPAARLTRSRQRIIATIDEGSKCGQSWLRTHGVDPSHWRSYTETD